jgi:hypothetical protein
MYEINPNFRSSDGSIDYARALAAGRRERSEFTHNVIGKVWRKTLIIQTIIAMRIATLKEAPCDRSAAMKISNSTA